MILATALAAPPAATVATATGVDYALSAAVLVTAGLALGSRARPAQVMAFLGLGVLMSLVWLRLGSVDVALAEAALGSGLLGAVLVRLALAGRGSRDVRQSASDPAGSSAWGGSSGSPGRDGISGGSGRGRRIAANLLGAVCGIVIVVLIAAVWQRAELTLPHWEPLVEPALPSTGMSHDVSGVLLAFRAYDTLLESAVLMLAAIAVLELGPRPILPTAAIDPARIPEPLRWFVRLAAPILLLVGLWLLFAGSSQSGGAFQSGALLAGLLILLHVAGVPVVRFARRWLRPLLVAGVVVFILMGALGPLMGSAWLSTEPEWAFAALLTVETVLAIGIAVGLFALFLRVDATQQIAAPQEVR